MKIYNEWIQVYLLIMNFFQFAWYNCFNKNMKEGKNGPSGPKVLNYELCSL